MVDFDKYPSSFEEANRGFTFFPGGAVAMVAIILGSAVLELMGYIEAGLKAIVAVFSRKETFGIDSQGDPIITALEGSTVNRSTIVIVVEECRKNSKEAYSKLVGLV